MGCLIGGKLHSMLMAMSPGGCLNRLEFWEELQRGRVEKRLWRYGMGVGVGS